MSNDQGQPAGWGSWQPPPPPPPAAPPGYGPSGEYWGYPQEAYAPTAREAAWPGRRSRRGWSIAVGLAVVLVAGAAGGLVAHAIGGSNVVRSSSAGNSPANGGGSGSGSGNGGFPFGNGPGSGSGNGSGGAPQGGPGSGTAPNTGGTGPADASSIAARVDPGLVDVNSTIDYGQAQGAGTGMVLTSGGEVLTNNHVIEGATSISVTDVGNGRTYTATVVGYSVSRDVAVLQLAGASGLQTVRTAGSARVSAGEEVVGIGNAGGSGGTPSYAGGTVTATDQSISANDQQTGTAEHLTGMIETNADIQAGDSGGPLVNASGQVIGMDTAGSQTFQFSQSGGAGYAVPIGVATSLARQITAGESSSTVHVGATAFLGVQIAGSGGGFGPGSGFGTTGNGVQISGVVSGSPAAGSGLAAGDVITSVGGHGVTSQSSLQAVIVNDFRPGQTVTVEYTDTAGQPHSVSVVLTSGPPA